MSARLIRGFLELINEAVPLGFKGVNGYKTLADFLLKHAQDFEPQPLPKHFRPMKIGNCYMNAAMLAMGSHAEHRLTYCEGYALNVFPVQHAWCIDPSGKVIDPTWAPRRGRRIRQGSEYFGIPIKQSYLMRRLSEQRCYGLIDRWEDGWPMLQDKPEAWRETL